VTQSETLIWIAIAIAFVVIIAIRGRQVRIERALNIVAEQFKRAVDLLAAEQVAPPAPPIPLAEPPEKPKPSPPKSFWVN
jgi:hypothetical protein